MLRKKQPKPGKSLADRGIFVRTEVRGESGGSRMPLYSTEFKPTGGKEIKLTAPIVSDADFYMEIWEEREHKCFETGKPLTGEPLTLYFHHLLGKAKYPQYRHEKWNIVLLHPDAHSQVETFIDKCPRVKALTEHLKTVYG